MRPRRVRCCRHRHAPQGTGHHDARVRVSLSAKPEAAPEAGLRTSCQPGPRASPQRARWAPCRPLGLHGTGPVTEPDPPAHLRMVDARRPAPCPPQCPAGQKPLPPVSRKPAEHNHPNCPLPSTAPGILKPAHLLACISHNPSSAVHTLTRDLISDSEKKPWRRRNPHTHAQKLLQTERTLTSA